MALQNGKICKTCGGEISGYAARNQLLNCDECLSKMSQYRKDRYTSNVHFVYVLIDPDTNAVRYVGKTNMLHIRFKDHIRATHYKGNRHAGRKLFQWLRTLGERDLEPIMSVIGYADCNQAVILEKFWIIYFLQRGAELTNSEQDLKRLRRQYPAFAI